MQDSCVDPINDAAAEAQYVSVEIDTQATDRYDDTSPDTEAFKQVIAPRAPPISNPEPRFTVPLDQDIPELDFKFTKPAHKTLILRPTKPSADIATAPLRRVVTPTSGTSSDAQEGSYSKNPFDLAKTALTIFQPTRRQMRALQSVKPRNSLELPLETRQSWWWKLRKNNVLLSRKKTQTLNLQEIYLRGNKSEGLALLQVSSILIDSSFS